VADKLAAQKLTKLAYGGLAGYGPAAMTGPPSGQAASASSTPAKPLGAGEAPTAPAGPLKPAKPRLPRGAGGRVARRKGNPGGNPQPMSYPMAVASGFFEGAGQGIKNMVSAPVDLVRGGVNAIASPIAAGAAYMTAENEAEGRRLANDAMQHYYAASRDVVNSFGRYVGVHDAWDPNTGQYRGAQPANSAGQYAEEVIKPQITDSDLSEGYDTAMGVRDSAAAAVPLAVAAPAAGAQLMRVPGVARAGQAITSNPAARWTINYGFGVPVGKPNPAAFIASNLGQNFAGNYLDQAAANRQLDDQRNAENIAQSDQLLEAMSAEGLGETEQYAKLLADRDKMQAALDAPAAPSWLSQLLPAYQLDKRTRELAGDLAPEVLDSLRMGSLAPVQVMLGQQIAAKPIADTMAGVSDVATSGVRRLDNYLNPDNPALPQEDEQPADPFQDAADFYMQQIGLNDAPPAGGAPEFLDENVLYLDDELSATGDGGAGPNEAQIQNTGQENFPYVDAVTYANPEDRAMLYAESLQMPEQVAEQSPQTAGPETAAASPPGAPVESSAPNQPPDIDGAVTSALPPDTSAEDSAAAVAAAGQAAETVAAMPDAERDRLRTPEGAEAFNAENAERSIDQIANDRMSQETAPENPRDFATWASDIVTWAGQQWESLGTLGKLAFGLGMPLGVIGLLGGGLGGVLTAVLGFGAAGFAAASSGMFGETAQNAATTATGAVSSGAQQVVDSVTGGAQPAVPPPENATPETSLLYQIAGAPAEGENGLEQIVKANKETLAGILGKSDAEIKQILDGLPPQIQKKLEGQLNTIGWGLWLGKVEDDPATPINEIDELKSTKDRLLGIIKGGHDMQHLNNKSASQIVAQHLAIASLQKAARCWSGYEPVPGKKPYSNDSCRPVGSKKKKKKKAAK